MPRWSDDEEEDRAWRRELGEAGAAEVDVDEEEDAFGGESSPETNESPGLVPCLACRREIIEDSAKCPHCGEFQSREERRWTPKPLWFLVGVALCLYVVYRWVF